MRNKPWRRKEMIILKCIQLGGFSSISKLECTSNANEHQSAQWWNRNIYNRHEKNHSMLHAILEHLFINQPIAVGLILVNQHRSPLIHEDIYRKPKMLLFPFLSFETFEQTSSVHKKQHKGSEVHTKLQTILSIVLLFYIWNWCCVKTGNQYGFERINCAAIISISKYLIIATQSERLRTSDICFDKYQRTSLLTE